MGKQVVCNLGSAGTYLFHRVLQVFCGLVVGHAPWIEIKEMSVVYRQSVGGMC
jgi:hypothetical protein